MTRPRDRQAPLHALLEARGAVPASFPTTVLVPPEDPGPLCAAAARVSSYDWIVVTSRTTVPYLLEALEGVGTADAVRAAGPRPRFCAVGPGTAESLREAGLPVDLVPSRFVAEGVVEAMGPALAGLRVLYPRAEGAREVIPDGLREAGARVEAVDAYRTAEDADGARALAAGVAGGEVDVVTFTAASTGRSFAAAWRERDEAGPTAPPFWPPEVGVVSIGPATAEALLAEGLPVHRVAEPHTLEGLVAAVESWARERRDPRR